MMDWMGRLRVGFKAGLRAARLGSAHPGDPALAQWFGGRDTASGKAVSVQDAQTIVTVMRAVRIISCTIASLPLLLYRERSDGGKERARSPLYDLLKNKPNRWQTAYEWKQMMQTHLCLRGNAYSEIISSRSQSVKELIPLDPDRVLPFWAEEGKPAYRYQQPDGAQRIILGDEMLHLKDITLDGLVGVSRITAHREALGLSLAQDEHAARLFSNGATIRGVLQTEQKLSDDARERLRKDWKDRFEGPENAHKTAVLEQGLKWQNISVSPEDAQFLQSRRFSVIEIGRVFDVAPQLLFELQNTNRATSEQVGLEFLIFTLMPWLKMWEQRINADLVTDADTYAEFLVDGLLRGDFQTRTSGYAMGRQWGWLSQNDIRRLENMNPIGPEGDVYLSPLNMAPTDQLASGIQGLMDDQKKPRSDKGDV